MGGQVKDLIVLAELSLIPFSFILEIQQSVQVILIVSFVSSGVQKGVNNSRLKERGVTLHFFYSFFQFYQRAKQNLFLACLTED